MASNIDMIYSLILLKPSQDILDDLSYRNFASVYPKKQEIPINEINKK